MGWPICSERVAYFPPKGRPVCSEKRTINNRCHMESTNMFISELYIEKFRLFQKNKFKIGKYMTQIYDSHLWF